MANILIIDDSGLIRTKMASILRSLGYTTVQAINGKDGLEKVEAESFDCVFTDLLMPEMDGFGFLEEVKKQRPGLPVVVISADIQQATHDRCMGLGAIAILPKPPKPEAVQQILSTILQAN